MGVQTLLRRVMLLPVRSLSAADLLQSLLTLACREGNLSFIHSDPASNTRPWATRSNEMKDSSGKRNISKQFPNNPWVALCTDLTSRRLRERGCVFRISGVKRSHVQSEADNIVREVKSYLSLNEDNFNNHENIDDYDLTFLLEKIASFCNSKPLVANSHLSLSAHDLVTAAGRAGPHSGGSGLSLSELTSTPDPGEETSSHKLSGKDRMRNIQADCNRLRSLTHFLHQSLAFFFLPRLKLTLQPTSKRHRRGRPVEDLEVGDVCIDGDYVTDHGSCCGALARVVLLSEGNRMALLTRLKRNYLHDNSYLNHSKGLECLALHEQPCPSCTVSPLNHKHLEIICRDSQNLFLIAKNKQSGKEEDDQQLADRQLQGPKLQSTPSLQFTLPHPASLQKAKYGTVLPPDISPISEACSKLTPSGWSEFQGAGNSCDFLFNKLASTQKPSSGEGGGTSGRPRRQRKNPTKFGDFIRY